MSNESGDSCPIDSTRMINILASMLGITVEEAKEKLDIVGGSQTDEPSLLDLIREAQVKCISQRHIYRLLELGAFLIEHKIHCEDVVVKEWALRPLVQLENKAKRLENKATKLKLPMDSKTRADAKRIRRAIDKALKALKRRKKLMHKEVEDILVGEGVIDAVTKKMTEGTYHGLDEEHCAVGLCGKKFTGEPGETGGSAGEIEIKYFGRYGSSEEGEDVYPESLKICASCWPKIWLRVLKTVRQYKPDVR